MDGAHAKGRNEAKRSEGGEKEEGTELISPLSMSLSPKLEF